MSSQEEFDPILTHSSKKIKENFMFFSAFGRMTKNEAICFLILCTTNNIFCIK